MEYLIYGFAFLIFIIVIRYFLVFKQLVGLTLQYPKYELKSEDKLPHYLKNLLRIPLQELQPFGFKFCCYMEVESTVQDYWTRWDIILYNEELKTFATAHVNILPDIVNLFHIDFQTFFEDGFLLVTLNGQAHNIVETIPNTLIQDPYTSEIKVHWQTHQDKLKELNKFKIPKAMSAEMFAKAIQAKETAYVLSLGLSGKALRPAGTGLFYIELITALKTGINIIRGSAKSTAFLKQKVAKETEIPDVEIPVEIEVEAFQRLERFNRRRAKKELKFWLLVSSLLLFALVFTPWFKWQTLILLISILFLHEAGHFLAMRLCGYQDTSIFFLPFFGAAASGHKDNATLTEKVLVLLAGPMPGLFLGSAIGISMGSHLYKSTEVFSLVGALLFLNYFNLLPILPLDGGRIVNLLVFSRRPYLDVLFKIFTVVFFGFIGFVFRDPISLPLAIFIGCTIPASFRGAKILQQLKRQQRQSTGNTDSLLHSIFLTLRQTGYEALPFVHKYKLVKDIVQRCNESHASWRTKLSLLTLYLFCVLGGLVLIVRTFVPLNRIPYS